MYFMEEGKFYSVFKSGAVTWTSISSSTKPIIKERKNCLASDQQKFLTATNSEKNMIVEENLQVFDF